MVTELARLRTMLRDVDWLRDSVECPSCCGLLREAWDDIEGRWIPGPGHEPGCRLVAVLGNDEP